MANTSVDFHYLVSQSKKGFTAFFSALRQQINTKLGISEKTEQTCQRLADSNPGNTLCRDTSVSLGRKVFNLPSRTVQVVCNSRSIFILREGDCMIETHVYDATVKFHNARKFGPLYMYIILIN